MEDIKPLDVIIIGGGWSGILACKYMAENNLSVLALEATDDIGGVFKYREDVKDVGGVMKSTHLTSSKSFTEMSDFPMPNEYSEFPSHRQIYKYLNDYIDHFQIRKYFLLNTKIVSAEKKEDQWVLKDSKGQRYQSRYLVVSSGVHQHPDLSFQKDEKFRNATMKKMHGAAYKKITEEFEDKRILIYGGGETASDISSELAQVASQIFLSFPHGQWLGNRYRKTAEHINKPIANDNYSSEMRALCDPFEKGYYAKHIIEGESGFCGHGIEAWRSPARYLGQFLNKSAHINHGLVLGSIIPKREVISVSGNEVTFCDGSKEEVDLIIFCTGYKTEFPFFKDKKYTGPINERFKFSFDNNDPTLAFIGFVRPIIGSIPAVCEMQSMYVAKIFSEKLKLPSKKVRTNTINDDKEHQFKQFCNTSHRITGLVNFGIYIEQIGALLNMTPDFFKLFLKSPLKWWLAVRAPYNTCRFHLNDPTKHEMIFETLKNRIHPVFICNSIFLIKVMILGDLYWFIGNTKSKSICGKIIYGVNVLFTCLLWVLYSPVVIYKIIANRRRVAGERKNR